MRIWIQGESEMECFLRKRCEENGMALSSLPDSEIVMLGFPYTKITNDLESCLSNKKGIICGILDEETNQRFLNEDRILYQPLKDEEYLQKNAELTAEGAINAAMNRLPAAFQDISCLVIGYGRIGKALTRILRSLGAEVTVAARKPESRKEAGDNSIATDRIQYAIGNKDLILNTVPFPVISESGLLSIKNTAFLFELASRPYGFDMTRARKLGVHAVLESGIPGRYCPASAADNLFRYIERSVQIE